MSRQYWSETLAWATAAGTAVANTTTETIIFPNVTIPANYMQDGRVLRLTAYGQWGIQAAGNTFRIRVRWGGVAGTVLFDSSAITNDAVAKTAAQWKAEILLQTRSNGSSGTIISMGDCTFSTATSPTIATVTNYGCTVIGSAGGITTPAATTVDLTADTALSITWTWGTANASNTATGQVYTIEALN
jgi:hypothetical protein